jgi:hypothetical protein
MANKLANALQNYKIVMLAATAALPPAKPDKPFRLTLEELPDHPGCQGD